MVCAGAVAAIAPLAASAQDVANEAELPEVVVEGATLDAKAKPRIKKQAPSAPFAAPVQSSAPANKSKSSIPKPASTEADGSVDGSPSPQADSQPSASAQQVAPSTQNASHDDVSGVEARKIGTPVSVVTGEELKARQIRNAADALRSLPGVSVSASGGAGGQATQVRLRGAEGNHTLVVIDGIEANDTSSGEFDFSSLDAEDIERIEVLRGAQSGLYGSRAIGGVVNIITRRGKGPLAIRARTEAGSFGTRDAAVSASAANERGYFSAGFSARESDGFNIAAQGNEDDGYTRSSLNVRTGVTISDGLSADFSLRRSSTFTEFDTVDFFAPEGVDQVPVDSNNESERVVWLGGGKLTWEMFGGGLTHVAGGNFNTTVLQSADDFGQAKFDNARDRVFYQATTRFGAPDEGLRHSLSGLVESETETFTPSGNFNDGDERRRERLAYAGEYRGEFLDRVFPTASIRREDNDTFVDFTSWKAGVSVDVREIGVRPHASVGTAVALPGMFEQFGSVLGAFVGNPNLVPEESFGWDAGVEFTLLAGKAVVDVTYFEADLENEIVGFGTSLLNLTGESKRQGLEVAARSALFEGVTVGAAYTWLDATDPTGLAETRRPEHSGRADVNYVFSQGRGLINVAAIYNGTVKDSAFFNLNVDPFFGSRTVTLDSYWLVNVAASYQVAPGVEIYGRVENLLDEQYQEVFGFEAPDIAAYAGVRLTYEDGVTAFAQ